MAGLTYVTAEGATVRVALRATFTVGRDAQNDLVLAHDKKVSKQHVRIRQVGDTYVVEDLASRNGTSLDRGSKVMRLTEPQPLQPHDVIRVGSTRLVFDTEPAPEPPQPARAGSQVVVPPSGLQGDFATEVFGRTIEGRYVPPPFTLEQAQQRIAELEQQLAELRATLAKKPGEQRSGVE